MHLTPPVLTYKTHINYWKRVYETEKIEVYKYKIKILFYVQSTFIVCKILK